MSEDEEVLLFQNRIRFCQQLLRNKLDQAGHSPTKISRSADLKARQVHFLQEFSGPYRKVYYLTDFWRKIISRVLASECIIPRAWTVQSKKEPSIFLKVQSKRRQVISSEFPKSLKL